MAAAAWQTVRAQLHGLGAVVFKPQHHKAVLGVDGRADQPFFWVLLGQHTLGGVVQRCADDGAYLPRCQKIQQRAVCDTGHVDAVLLAVQAFGRQQRVQHRVSGLVLGLIAADVALHLSQSGILLGLIPLGPDGRDLHFQFVVAPVDQAYILLALAVLLILALQNVVHRRKLAVQRCLAQLLVLDAQNQHPGKIHQRADVVDAHRCLFVGDKAQVAHGKYGQRHNGRHQCGRRRNLQPRGDHTAALQPVQPPVQCAVDSRQQQQRRYFAAPAPRPEPAVQLPFQTGCQLRQNKRPRAAVAGLPQVHLPRGPEVEIHRRDSRHHAGHPPRKRYMAGQMQKHCQQNRPDGGYAPVHRLCSAGRPCLRIQQRSQDLRQRRVQPRYIR